jgi:sugar phosphate isomerase/epimerase
MSHPVRLRKLPMVGRIDKWNKDITVTRREFTGMLSAGVALAGGAVLSSTATPSGDVANAKVETSNSSRMRLGIGLYTYHRLSIDKMIEQLRALQIEEVEMSRGEFMLFAKPSAEMFRSARSNFDKAGIRCVSYYTATIKDDGDLESAVRFAKLLGARNITGDATGDILRRIDKRLTDEDLTFGIHNHFFKQRKFAYESPEDVLQGLSGLSKTMGATLDVGQMASCGFDTVDAVRKLAPHLKLVHLKDVKASRGEVNVLLGQGIARIPEVMSELKRVNYRGLVAIEYEHEGPVEEDVRQEVAYARKLL